MIGMSDWVIGGAWAEWLEWLTYLGWLNGVVGMAGSQVGDTKLPRMMTCSVTATGATG